MPNNLSVEDVYNAFKINHDNQLFFLFRRQCLAMLNDEMTSPDDYRVLLQALSPEFLRQQENGELHFACKQLLEFILASHENDKMVDLSKVKTVLVEDIRKKNCHRPASGFCDWALAQRDPVPDIVRDLDKNPGKPTWYPIAGVTFLLSCYFVAAPVYAYVDGVYKLNSDRFGGDSMSVSRLLMTATFSFIVLYRFVTMVCSPVRVANSVDGFFRSRNNRNTDDKKEESLSPSFENGH